MIINNGNPLDLAGSDGERIQIDVQTHQAVSDMLLNGNLFTAPAFTLSKLADPNLLTVAGLFTNVTQGGGWFEVTLTGSSGRPAVYRVAQFQTQGRKSVTFNIDVV